MSWEKVYLKELIKIKNGKDYKDLKEGVYPVYGSGGVLRYVDNYLYNRESVLLPRKGSLNNIQYANTPFWTVDTCYYTEIFTDKIIPYFLFGKLRQLNIEALNTGSAIPSMTFDKYYSIQISLPPLEIQEKIVEILRVYDSLIENNQKQIKLLEEAAQRLYKEWFVDLRFPGYENVSIVDGVPEGWAKGVLEDVAVFKRGEIITKSQVKEGNVPVVAGGLEPAYYHDKANAVAPVITVSGSGANAGFTRLYNIDVFASDCSFADSETTSYLYFVYCFLRCNKASVEALQKGAAQPHVYAKDINALELNIPTEDKLESYSEYVAPYFETIKVLQRQIDISTEARDRLLPKLMSGELELQLL